MRYLLYRLIYAVPTLVGLTVIIFLLMRIVPANPVDAYLGAEGVSIVTPQQRANALHALGLDKPLWVQYGDWMKGVFTGSLGTSLLRGDNIAHVLERNGEITVEITLLSVVISWIVGVPAGMLSALRPNSWLDAISSFFSVILLAVPDFWAGLLIVLLLITWMGYEPPITISLPWQNPWANLQIVIFPALVLGLRQAGYLARMARSSLLEVLREDYVRTARAKGLREQPVILRHVFPNALLPVLTLSGVLLAVVLGGTVAVEIAFNTPGLGRFLVNSALEGDMNVVQNAVLFYGVIFVIVNLGVDLLYGWVDPRIRLE